MSVPPIHAGPVGPIDAPDRYDAADRLVQAVDRLVTRIDDLHRDIISVFDRRTAADEARTAMFREVCAAVLQTPMGRALIALVVIRVAFGSAADAVIIALVSRATGLPVGP